MKLSKLIAGMLSLNIKKEVTDGVPDEEGQFQAGWAKRNQNKSSLRTLQWMIISVCAKSRQRP